MSNKEEFSEMVRMVRDKTDVSDEDLYQVLCRLISFITHRDGYRKNYSFIAERVFDIASGARFDLAETVLQKRLCELATTEGVQLSFSVSGYSPLVTINVRF